MSQRDGDVLRCSFCGKSQHEVRKLIAGRPCTLNEVRSAQTSSPRTGYTRPKSSQQKLPKPHEIKAHWNDVVIGQESAKKKVGGVSNHYRCMRYQRPRHSESSCQVNICSSVRPAPARRCSPDLAASLPVPFSRSSTPTLSECRLTSA